MGVGCAAAEGDVQIADAEGAKTSEVRQKVTHRRFCCVPRLRRGHRACSSSRWMSKPCVISRRCATFSLELIAKRDSGDKLVFVPYESSGVLGSLGGIKELLIEVKS